MRALVLVAVVCACGGERAGDTTVKQPPPAPGPAIDAAPERGVAIGDGRVDARLVNEPGTLVPLAEVLVPGKVTVIDFWAEWCGACDLMEEKLFEAIAGQPGIAVRKLDIVDDVSEVSLHYRVGRMLPEMRIYDRHGALVHQLIGNDCLRAGELTLELAARPSVPSR